MKGNKTRIDGHKSKQANLIIWIFFDLIKCKVIPYACGIPNSLKCIIL